MYRIVEWDERYEVDTKGRDWAPGKPKFKGPFRYIKLKANGRSLGVGYRRLAEAAGQDEALQVFGLFCKLLEIAGNASRDERNQLGDIADIAYAIQAPVSQVENGINVLVKIGWVETDSELSETFRPTEPNRTELNQTQPEGKDISEQAGSERPARGASVPPPGPLRSHRDTSDEQTAQRPTAPASPQRPPDRPDPNSDDPTPRPVPVPPSPSGPPVSPDGPHESQPETPDQPSADTWQSARKAVRTAFGHDAGIEQNLKTIAASEMLSDPARIDEIAGQIRALVTEAQAKGTRPKAYFVGALKKRFPTLDRSNP